jgi:TonB family protein
MPVKARSRRATFGLLPEPERNAGSFITSAVINGIILALMLFLGVSAKKTLDQHKYEETLLIVPSKPTPPPPKVKLPPPPKVEEKPLLKMEEPKIIMPRVQPKPDLKPIQLETKPALPNIKEVKPEVKLAPQPKPIMAAAMPAQDNHIKASTKPVHFGDAFGVTPNPNAKGPATVAAIGNPYGGMQGAAIDPHGRVGSTGIGNGTKYGSNTGTVGKVASVGISAAPTAVVQVPQAVAGPPPTQPEVSIPKPTYTQEARSLKIQGNVILRVTFFANGRIQVVGVVQGLGHGLDEQARLAVQQGRVLRPATRNGQPVDMTTNVTITFQLA